MLLFLCKSSIETFHLSLLTFHFTYGGVAHLVERLNGIQEVRSSILLVSTNRPKDEHLLFPRRLRRDGVVLRAESLKTSFQTKKGQSGLNPIALLLYQKHGSEGLV